MKNNGNRIAHRRLRGDCSRPLQTLEPTTTPNGPGIKSEMVFPPFSTLGRVRALRSRCSRRQKPRQQALARLARPQGQAATGDDDRGAEGRLRARSHRRPHRRFPDAHSTAAILAETIAALPGLDRTKLLVFGGWESASRGAGVTLQLVGERLGIADQFQGVDQIDLRDDGSFEVLERVEGGKHQVSVCAGAPAVLGWATGNLAEPRNNPQVGMANMRTIMPALQKAKTAALEANSLSYVSVSLPKQQRETRVEKNMSAEEIARELVEWIGAE